MPRIQRKKSKTGYYHIIIRGNEKRNIFNDDKDRLRFIDILYQKKKKDAFHLHAFCLMDNHVHMMMSEGLEDIAKVMQRITVSYVYYFNQKYKREGHLFQDRFRSEVVENDSYLISLARYIHQNPVKAGMVKSAGDYKWSSYNAYVNKRDFFNKIIDKEIVLAVFSDQVSQAEKLFIEFTNMQSQQSFLDILEEENVMDEDEAREVLKSLLENRKIEINGPIPNDLLKEFRIVTGLAIRKIAKLTGMNKDKVNRILKEK